MIIAIVVLGIVAVLVFSIVCFYYFGLPTFVANKLRNGENKDGEMSYPENYEKIAAKISVVKDLKYLSKYPSNEFDLYLPKEGDNFPLLIWVHGGGFIAGSKDGGENVMTALCAKGYAVASINYCVAPEYKYPTAILQIQEFTAHLKKIKADYPSVDISKLVYCGDSAGAQLAAQYVCAQTNFDLAKKMNLDIILNRDCIKATMFVCGPFNLPAIREYARVNNKKFRILVDIWGRAYFGKIRWYKTDNAYHSAVTKNVTHDFPPTFLTDGNNGSFEVQNRALAKALRDKNVCVEELYFDEAVYGKVNHEYLFHLADKISVDAIDVMANFLQRQLKV